LDQFSDSVQHKRTTFKASRCAIWALNTLKCLYGSGSTPNYTGELAAFPNTPKLDFIRLTPKEKKGVRVMGKGGKREKGLRKKTPPHPFLPHNKFLVMALA